MSVAALTPFKNTVDELLINFVEKRDLHNVVNMLMEGANPGRIASVGRTSVGLAAYKGYAEILEVLLKSYETGELGSSSTHYVSKKPRTEQEVEYTPDGMDGLQWEDEITSTPLDDSDDEWSRLYIYYGRMFEKTGNLMSRTIKLRDPHNLDRFSQAPLHYATILGHVDCVKLLLKYDSPVDIATKNGVTPLHLAIRNYEIMRILLNHNADPNRIIFNTGESTLHIAAQLSNVEIMELLLDNGANINALNQLERTPLMTAIMNSNVDVAIFLVDRNAKINIRDNDCHTALFYAVLANNIELVKFLMGKGAQIVNMDNMLHECVNHNFLEMAKIFLATGEDINRRNFDGSTPLCVALKNCNPDFVEYLMDNGGKCFDRDSVKELHLIIQHAQNIEQFKKVARILFAKGISFNAENYWYETPLTLAIMLEKFTVAEFLIKEGADVNKGRCQSHVGNFVLTRETSNINMFKLLVNAGLYLNIRSIKNLRRPPFKNMETSFDDCLSYHACNPLSLKSLCRIVIRQCVTSHKSFHNPIPVDYDEPKIGKFIKTFDIPKALMNYLVYFDDLLPI